MKIDIVDGERFHCGQIARTLRAEHHLLLLRKNVNVHRELRKKFDASYYRRSAFIDGYLAAVWGVEGSPLSFTGQLWLALSQYALRYPLAVLRQAKVEIEHVSRLQREIVTTVQPEDEAAHRLVVWLGFETADGFGGGPAHTRSRRNNLLRYMSNNPELVHDYGGGGQIGVIWRKEWNEAF